MTIKQMVLWQETQDKSDFLWNKQTEKSLFLSKHHTVEKKFGREIKFKIMNV